MKTVHAQIYKAGQRGCSESELFRRYATFNFGDYQQESRNPFGVLLALNDETLGPKNKVFRHIEENTDIVIIPLVGGVLYRDNLGNESIIETEQIRIFSAEKGASYELVNPFGKELVNYLQIWLRPNSGIFGSRQQEFSFPEKNKLVTLFNTDSDTTVLKTNLGAIGCIGIYEGRKEGTYRLRNPENGLFAFVINGAFEFENRLLESRDGLSLQGIESAEFEALSENAVVLILEIPLPQ